MRFENFSSDTILHASTLLKKGGYLCRLGMKPLELLLEEVPWSEADHTLLAGLEPRWGGNDGVGGCG